MMAGRDGWSRQASYVIGKTITYTALGAIVGGVGATAAMFTELRTAFALIIGLALVVSGFVWIGVLPNPVKAHGFSRRLAAILSSSLKRSGPLAPFSLGLANGLLPCGLLYGALAIAATSMSAWMGAASMAVFGLATIPSLALFGILVKKIGDPLVQRTHVLGGIAMIVFGVITLLRALPLGSEMMN